MGGARLYQQIPAASFYPPGDPNDIYSSGDDVVRNAQFHGGQGSGGPHMPPYPQQSVPNQYQQRLFPSPFAFPSMAVLDPANDNPAGFTHMQQPQPRKRPKYTRSKAGCLTCRTKKIKVRHVNPGAEFSPSLLYPHMLMRLILSIVVVHLGVV
jgi:hypothetical protein